MSERQAQLAGAARVAIAASLWGTWSLFLRPAGLPAAVSGAMVFLVMGVVTLPAALRAPPPRWDAGARRLLGANAVLDATNVLTFFAAMEVTTVAVAVLTHYLAPVLVALLAPAVERRRVPGAVAGALVSCGGLILVLAPWRGVGGDVGLGGALGAASAFAYAGNVFVVRRLAPRIGPARVVSYHSFLSAALMAPFAIAAGVVPGPTAVAWVGGGAVVLGALAGLIFVRGLATIGSARTAMLTYLEPVVAVGVGAIAFGEPVGPTAALGAVLVVATGVWIARQTPVAV